MAEMENGVKILLGNPAIIYQRTGHSQSSNYKKLIELHSFFINKSFKGVKKGY